MDLQRIDPSVLIKRKKVYPGSTGQVLSIPADYVKLFGPIDDCTMLLGDVIVIVPDRGKKNKIDIEKYKKVMDGVAKILGV